ncbi:glycerol kinase [Candidatus Neomarinimicrobiota bacterium]
MNQQKYISTTALAKLKGVSTGEMFSQLVSDGLIEKEGETWKLTSKGVEIGGIVQKSKDFRSYIAWPESLHSQSVTKSAKLTATAIGKVFGLPATKINSILSELGWIQKGLKGWVITIQGSKQGGVQSEDIKSGVPYVRWPEGILQSNTLIETIKHFKGEETTPSESHKEEVGFREKYEAKHRATDGHFVRSKAEMLIDNWLYMAEIVHAYERKLPIEENVYCDFYIPTGKVYIEYWGYENDEKYLERKDKKLAIYKKYGFNLIELSDNDVKNLDDNLPKQLLKFGVQSY